MAIVKCTRPALNCLIKRSMYVWTNTGELAVTVSSSLSLFDLFLDLVIFP